MGVLTSYRSDQVRAVWIVVRMVVTAVPIPLPKAAITSATSPTTKRVFDRRRAFGVFGQAFEEGDLRFDFPSDLGNTT